MRGGYPSGVLSADQIQTPADALRPPPEQLVASERIEAGQQVQIIDGKVRAVRPSIPPGVTEREWIDWCEREGEA